LSFLFHSFNGALVSNIALDTSKVATETTDMVPPTNLV
jgi:hypothetical protein